MIQKFEITFNELPVSKIMKIGKAEFEFRFLYNSKYDNISVEIYSDGELVHTTRLVYGSDVFSNTNLSEFPLIPFTEENISLELIENISVGKDTFGESVFLMFDDGV
ncbi:MAG: hypothetical protein KDK36_02950 [Leptospiraceae bacterium]|nr:hypothetical protein [Leptospiraceae bacterium]